MITKQAIITKIINPYKKYKGIFGKFKKNHNGIKNLLALIDAYDDNIEIPVFDILNCFYQDLTEPFTFLSMKHWLFPVTNNLAKLIRNNNDNISIYTFESELFHNLLLNLKINHLFEEKYINMILNHISSYVFADYLIQLHRLNLETQENLTKSQGYKTLSNIAKILQHFSSFSQSLLNQLFLQAEFENINKILDILNRANLSTHMNLERLLNLPNEVSLENLAQHFETLSTKKSLDQEIFDLMVDNFKVTSEICTSLNDHNILNKNNIISIYQSSQKNILLEIIGLYWKPGNAFLRLNTLTIHHTKNLHIRLNQQMFDLILRSTDPNLVYQAIKELENKNLFGCATSQLNEAMQSDIIAFCKGINTLSSLHILNNITLGSLSRLNNFPQRVAVYALLVEANLFKPKHIQFVNQIDSPVELNEIFSYLMKHDMLTETTLSKLFTQNNRNLFTPLGYQTYWLPLISSSQSFNDRSLDEIISKNSVADERTKMPINPRHTLYAKKPLKNTDDDEQLPTYDDVVGSKNISSV